MIEAAAAAGIPIDMGTTSSEVEHSGAWRPLSATQIYVNCPAESQTHKTYTIDVDDDAGTLTLTDEDGSVVMVRVTE